MVAPISANSSCVTCTGALCPLGVKPLGLGTVPAGNSPAISCAISALMPRMFSRETGSHPNGRGVPAIGTWMM